MQKVGSEVERIKVGDRVLLSFSFCSKCKDCKEQHVAYCQQSNAINYGGEQNVFMPQNGTSASGLFFGQSSFSKLAIVKENSAVNVSGLVRNDEELKLFAPLGCGFQTGMGTVSVLTGAGKKDSVVICGLGGVGLAAVMVRISSDIVAHLLITPGCKNTRMCIYHRGGPISFKTGNCKSLRSYPRYKHI